MSNITPTDLANVYSRRTLLRGMAGISILAAGTLAGCSFGSDSDPKGSGGKPVRGGTLRMAIADGSPTDQLDPAMSVTNVTGLLTTMIFKPLVRLDLDSKLHPGLADSWSVSDDATEWTFNLRTGVTFHDGSPLTARDAAWTIHRLLDSSLNSPYRDRFASSLTQDGIEVVDDHKLTLHLSRPDAFFGESLAMWYASIVKENQNTFTVDNTVGNGPFKLKSFRPGESFEVVRNPSYYDKGRPYLDGIQHSAVDPSTALQALSSGSIDWTDCLDPKSVARLKGDDRFRSPALEGDTRALRMYFIHMKLDTEPFTDPRVVMAMKLAADRNAIIKAVLGGLGTVTGDVPVPMSHPLYPKSVGKRPQDLAKARQLLADAGYPDGIDVELPTADFQPGMTDLSIAFAETVKPAGIRVKVKQVPANTYFDREFGQSALFNDYSQTFTPYTMASMFFQKGGIYNGTGFDSDGELSKRLDAARKQSDEAQRNQMLSDILGYIADNSGTHIPFMIPITQTSTSSVHGDLYEVTEAWENLWMNR